MKLAFLMCRLCAQPIRGSVGEQKKLRAILAFSIYCSVEKPAEIQTSIRIVRAPNSRTGGREFESPLRRELGALAKSGKTLVVRSFYNNIKITDIYKY
jgi:hypothetical protein